MDIFLTIIASILLIIGFFVICKSSDDDEEETLPGEDNPNHHVEPDKKV